MAYSSFRTQQFSLGLLKVCQLAGQEGCKRSAPPLNLEALAPLPDLQILEALSIGTRGDSKPGQFTLYQSTLCSALVAPLVVESEAHVRQLQAPQLRVCLLRIHRERSLRAQRRSTRTLHRQSPYKAERQCCSLQRWRG